MAIELWVFSHCVFHLLIFYLMHGHYCHFQSCESRDSFSVEFIKKSKCKGLSKKARTKDPFKFAI
jgi:hypothetical protein